jgi:hypothetical protein
MAPTIPLSDVAIELQRIRDAHGGILRAADVVAEAADPASPLHSRFTWDDGEAAYQWRLQEARQLIRVVVGFFPAPQGLMEFRIYTSMQQDRHVPGGGYRVVLDVIGSPAWRQRLLAQALAELNHFRNKYRELEELVNAVDAAMAHMAAAQQQQGTGSNMPPPTAGGGPSDVAIL